VLNKNLTTVLSRAPGPRLTHTGHPPAQHANLKESKKEDWNLCIQYGRQLPLFSELSKCCIQFAQRASSESYSACSMSTLLSNMESASEGWRENQAKNS
jgi:hypothetical protein